MTGKLVVGITGASGAIYAQRFLIEAAKHFDEIFANATFCAIFDDGSSALSY
jgi:3-polyprenyl-4-hydroxybenzoate decarboxylase